MNRQQLFEQIKEKKSFLIIGLDTDTQKMPKHVKTQFEFNKAIIDSTNQLCVGYKLNLAFYEAEGVKGWENLEKTEHYVREKYPDLFLIADAKRGDIGNTSSLYARAFFETMDFDAITVAPYMGEDSVSPFLTYADKWAIILALTSNKGADDFQLCQVECEETNWEYLYETVLNTSKKWGTTDNMMYVVGATKAESLAQIRKLVPEHFILVPGVGAQGGSLAEVAKYGMNSQCGLLVNSSRQIIYAGLGCGLDERHFALHSRNAAKEVQLEMSSLLEEVGLVGKHY